MFSTTIETLVELKWIIFKKNAHTFDSKNSMTEVLKIDSSQIIRVQVFCQFFHLKKKKDHKICVELGASSVAQLAYMFYRKPQVEKYL